jgi:hypothetical protein
MHHVFKDAILRGGQIDEAAGAAHRLLQPVHLDIGHREDWMRCSLAPADERLGAGDELAKIKWLAEIVVGPGIEQLDARESPVFRSQDKHRRCMVTGPEAPQ